MPERHQRVIGRIHARWQDAADGTCLTLFGSPADRSYTGRELCALAGRYATGLLQHGVRPGDRVGMILPTGEAFLGAFFGAWWIGATPMPLSPPLPRHGLGNEADRILRSLQVGKPRLTVIDPLLSPYFEEAPGRYLLPDALDGGDAVLSPADQGGLALVQFSSGSTGHPKGVALQDSQVTANLESLTALIGAKPGERMVSWVPLHHDMGLIGSLLWSQFSGVSATLMPPDAFIRDPGSWLRYISEQRIPMSAAPNFAFQLCSRLPDARLDGLDLSCLEAVMIGAEPVRPSSLRAFVERMAPYGLRSDFFMPCFGLAEAVVCVTSGRRGKGLIVDRIQLKAYHEAHVALPATADEDGLEVMSVGPPLPGVTVEIRDAEGRVLPERQVGEIVVATPSRMDGYFEDAEATAAVMLPDGFLKTGDLGYLADGQLYISGRIKDVIIRGGSKYYPQDLETAAEGLAGIRQGGTTAFIVPGDPGQPDRVVVLAEVAKGSEPPASLPQDVRSRIRTATGLRVDEVVLVQANQLPKTTSGKLRRSEARQRFLAGDIERVHG